MTPRIMLLPIGFVFSGLVAVADDWPRFRGPAGAGIATDSGSMPTDWSPTTNIAWKIPLPGPGASSPIIVGQQVFVTCYSGYGIDRKNPGEMEHLVRHLVCLDLTTGARLWQKDVPAWLPEDPYDKSGVSSHGYASHTPVSDGLHVYCFFGKGGVHAFDLHGNELWNAETGNESDPPRWGSSSSPIIHEDVLIVTAAAESQSIIGLEKATGRKLWQQFATGLDGMWGTPTRVEVDEDRTDIVLLVAEELWGLDPKTGSLRWFAGATRSQQAYTSVISRGNRVFAFSGVGAGSVALDIENDVDTRDTSIAWTSSASATYGTPVLHRSKIYVVSRGMLTVVNADTGERLEQIRLQNFKKTGNARFGSLDYASPVVAGDRLFYLNAGGQVYVFQLGEKTELLTVNPMTTDKELFWGTPALSDGRMIVRSSEHLYCIAETDQPAKSRDTSKTSQDTSGKGVASTQDLQSTEAPDDAPMSHGEKVRGRDDISNRFQTDAANAVNRPASSTKLGKQARPRRPSLVGREG